MFDTWFVFSSISLFEEQSIWPDVVLVRGDKVLALVIKVADLDNLRVLHVDSVLDEDLVARALILESGGILLGQCRIRGAVDTWIIYLSVLILFSSWILFTFSVFEPLSLVQIISLSRDDLSKCVLGPMVRHGPLPGHTVSPDVATGAPKPGGVLIPTILKAYISGWLRLVNVECWMTCAFDYATCS